MNNEILIVDDEKDIRELIGELLEDEVIGVALLLMLKKQGKVFKNIPPL